MIFWGVLNGFSSMRVIAYGGVISIVIILLTSDVLFKYDSALSHLPSLWRFFWFGGVVFIAIVKSSMLHLLRIMKNESTYERFYVMLESDNVVIGTLIANAITMTPGTITIDLEKNCLEVVGFAQSQTDVDALIKEIKGFEKPFIYRRS
jgi:multicomponent Na+:H+ antiporter subunit E